jgi:lysosomal Pro-X carboxypeptidase
MIYWGGREVAASSNIVFSNGLMDPWHGTGLLESISDTLVAVKIPEVGSSLFVCL